MLISEIKRWAKEKGYTVNKDKEDGLYYWTKLDAVPEISGVAKSVSKVATAIFNHISEDKWVEHQIKFKEEEDIKFPVSDYGS